jgi:hypothetical protein
MAIDEAALDDAVRLYRQMWARDLAGANQPLIAKLRPTTVTLIILAYRRIVAREAASLDPLSG